VILSDPLINDDRRCKITRMAWELWNDFLNYSQRCAEDMLNPAHFGRAMPPGGRVAEVEIQPTTYPRNSCAVQFFRYCAQIFVGAAADVVNYGLDESAGVPNYTGRATSWLFNIPTRDYENYPLVIIDANFLAGQEPPLELAKIWTRLLLHEIGHLVLHWEELDAQRVAGRIPAATAPQESEAWWFCFVVLGFSVSSYAFSIKGTPTTRHEDAWRFV